MTLEFCPQCLRCVFINVQTILISNGLNSSHICNTTIELGRHYSFCLWCNCASNGIRIDRMIRTNLHRNWNCTGEMDGGGSGNHCMGTNNYFIANLYSTGHEPQLQSIRSISHANSIFYTAISSNALLKILQILLHDKCTAGAHILQYPEKFIFLGSKYVWIIKKWYFHNHVILKSIKISKKTIMSYLIRPRLKIRPYFSIRGSFCKVS